MIQKYATYFTIGATVLGVVLVIVMSCGKPTPPPFDSDFIIQGKHVKIEAKLKAGTSVSMAEAQRYLKTAADMIDFKGP